MIAPQLSKLSNGADEDDDDRQTSKTSTMAFVLAVLDATNLERSEWTSFSWNADACHCICQATELDEQRSIWHALKISM